MRYQYRILQFQWVVMWDVRDVYKRQVDKRIDVLATAIHAGLKATQLKDLDLAYAPPYSSAKDPVNMAGFMIDNIAKGILKQWHLEDMDKISKDKDVVLLDVRTVGEFNRGHVDVYKRQHPGSGRRQAECSTRERGQCHPL